MKAVSLEKTVANAKDLKVSQVAELEAQEGKVIVKNEFAGINFIDVYLRKGQFPVQLPFVLGMEGGGHVHQLPSGYQGDLKVGDAVVYLGKGSYAEYTTVDPTTVFKVPTGLELDIATAYLLQGMTANYLTAKTFKVTKGAKVLVLAAAGGTGALLARMCKQLGAIVIGTVSTEAKARLAQEYCDHVINYADADLVSEVKKIAKEGVDVVYDSVGKGTLDSSAMCLKSGGTLVSFGSSSGNATGKPGRKDITFKEDTLFNHTTTREEFLSLAKQTYGNVLPVKIFKIYPLEAVGEAHADLEGRKTTGKLLLKI